MIIRFLWPVDWDGSQWPTPIPILWLIAVTHTLVCFLTPGVWAIQCGDLSFVTMIRLPFWILCWPIFGGHSSCFMNLTPPLILPMGFPIVIILTYSQKSSTQFINSSTMHISWKATLNSNLIITTKQKKQHSPITPRTNIHYCNIHAFMAPPYVLNLL